MNNEKDVIIQLQNGDSAAWEKFVKDQSDHLIKYGLSVSRDLTEVKEALSDTWLKLLEKRRSINSIRDIRAYMFIVYRNTLTNRLITNQRQPSHDYLPIELFEEIRIENNLEFEELRKAVRDAYKNLSPQEQQVLYLNVIKDIEAAQVAVILGIPITTVYSVKSNGIKKMKVELTNKMKWRRLPPTILIIVLAKLILVNYRHF